jgi:hypothetical protein
MRALVRGGLIITLVTACIVLGVSIWPGLLEDILLAAALLAIVWVPLVLLGVAATAAFFYRRRRSGHLDAVPRREAFAILLIAIVALLLLIFHIPRQVAFVLARASFEQIVQSAPLYGDTRTPVNYEGRALNMRLGLYEVDEHARHPLGGVFFRTHVGADGIGPDQMSYGFVYRPNPKATPFGSAQYSVFHIRGDWYWFRVSDDY